MAATTAVSPPPAPRRVVVLPYPGRGHFNPILNLCKSIASKSPETRFTFVVTEEWLGLIGSEPKPPCISFATIPNVLPSEKIRGSDLVGFVEVVFSFMAEPVEEALDRLPAPPDLIIADNFLIWAAQLGRKRNVPVASFWPASATTFLVTLHHHLLVKTRVYPVDLSDEECEERLDLIPGVPSIRGADLPGYFHVDNERMLNVVVRVVSSASEAQCIVFRTVDELEAQSMAALRASLSAPVYSIGPAIPCYESDTNKSSKQDYIIKWLDGQARSSVLYVSLGSFLSTSSAQSDELEAGLRQSGVPFLWVARDHASWLSASLGDKGMVVPWCDQMEVLRHGSVGGFLTHCGWNSTLETVFAGVPTLVFPLGIDQTTNAKAMVEDWGTAWRLKVKTGCSLVERGEICALLKRFMDVGSRERKVLEERCGEWRERLRNVVADDASTSGLDLFLSDYLKICKG